MSANLSGNRLARKRTVKKSRISEAQIIAVLKEHETGVKTADLFRKHGISSATLYARKSKFGGLEISVHCLGGHPKCTSRGRLKMYQGSVAT